MARIRTIKPEFWEDESLGLLPRDARLLFAATFNLADDEGLLRWTAAYVKASAFMYDEDLSVADVATLMRHLTDSGLIFPYIGGAARQQLAVVVNFRKHQRINRPQKSKLPAPSLQNVEVRRMYARRDGWTCQLCGEGIPERPVVNDSHNLSIDHIKHQSAGGTDHPSNVRAAHQACNKSRKDSGDESFTPPASLAGLSDSLSDSMNRSVNDSLNDSHQSVTTDTATGTHSEKSSLNDSVNDSPPEGKGREGKGTGKGRDTPPPSAGPPKGAVTRGTRLPDPFPVTPEMAAWAAANAPSCGTADHEAFCDYWRGIPGAKGRKLDWVATWRNWMRREHERRTRNGNSRPAGRPAPDERAATIQALKHNPPGAAPPERPLNLIRGELA